MKCQIDWCGKELEHKKRPFESWYCPKCQILYFLRDGIFETLGMRDFKEWKSQWRLKWK